MNGATARRLLGALAPPAVFGILFVLAWEAAVKVFDWQIYFLSPPSRVWERFVDNTELIRKATFVSGANALAGLLVGLLLGVAMSFLLMRFRALNDMVNPLAIAVNAIPIVVLVSVFNNQFASTSEVPRRLMVTLIVYFVVLVNVAKGLRDVESTHLELMRSYAASPFAVMRKVRIPNAIPYLFTALKIAAPLAVITAFVAEYFGGTQNGLGSRIAGNFQTSKTDIGMAYVIGACLLGLTFYLVSVILESLISKYRGAGPKGEIT